MTPRRHFRRTRAAARSGVLSAVCGLGTLSVNTACGRVGYDLLDPLTEGPNPGIVATLGGSNGTPNGDSTLGSDPTTSSGPTSPTSNGVTPTNSSAGSGGGAGAPVGTGGTTSEAGAAGMGGMFAGQGGTNGSSGTGGTANGGMPNGGTANGGTANGGAANGGTANGGAANGGMANGGAANGGMANGGAANGGAANGGAANGGMANGGTASAGMANAGGGGTTGGAGGSSGGVGGSAEGGSGGVASPCVETEGGVEQCDGVDNDCSGTIDDGNACSAGCSGSVFFGGSYMFCSTALDPVAAAAACSAENMRLARINDSAENDYIDQLLAPEAWIGGSDSTEGLWLWPDGSVFWTGGAAPAGVYTHFDLNQPDENGGVSNEDCLVMRVNGFWNDKPCAVSLPFLCERY